jgi:membrane-associated protease RseP (regulator of RpoE activity)
MTVRIGWVLAVAVAALAGGFALAGVGDSPGAGAATGDEIARLRAELAVERSAREELASQLARVEADLAALRGPEPAAAVAPDAAAQAADAAEPTADAIAEAATDQPSPGHAWFDAARLAGAGLSERDAADLKRLFDVTELERLYLRAQATREGWPDGRLAQEIANLDQRLTSVRDDYGEAAYDWFLYAAGRPNRVKVEGILAGSAASEIGLRAGDHIYAYGGERMYRPWSLVQSTQSGRLGETVEVEVERGGERLRFTVPRGPIGVRIGRDTVEPPPVD